MKISYNVLPCKTCRFYHHGISDTFTCGDFSFCKKFKVTIPNDLLHSYSFADHVRVTFYCDSYVGEK